VIAPSANPAGQTSPTKAQQVLAYFDGKIELLLDGGSTSIGVESTVVDARGNPPVILREGAVRSEDILNAAKAIAVLFVCTGNSCRSVMAEYIFRKILKDMGRLDVEVFSAGTMALPGMGVTRETLKLVAGMGVDASGHKAQRVTPMMVQRADVILTMERRHYEDIVSHFPFAQKKAHVLGDYVGMDPAFSDIADPIGHSEDFYASCFAQIKAAVTRLKDRI
jgi:protein-tyrosine-phosphatase